MILNKDEYLKTPKMYRKTLREDIFIFPTDSMYSLGCDARNKELVSTIRTLKKSSVQPFSIIPPSRAWIEQNCVVTESQKPYLKHLDDENPKLKGKSVTLLLDLKEGCELAKNVTQGTQNVSIKIFDHWFMQEAKNLGIPLIYTSANPAGGDLMTDLNNLSDTIKKKVGLIIYEGEKTGSPSMMIN